MLHAKKKIITQGSIGGADAERYGKGAETFDTQRDSAAGGGI